MNESECRALQKNLAAASRRRVADQEHIARSSIALEQLEEWSLMLQSSFSSRTRGTSNSGSGDRNRVFEANRKLISNDLIEEMYGTITQQRDQIKQLLGALSMMNDRMKQPQGRSRPK